MVLLPLFVMGLCGWCIRARAIEIASGLAKVQVETLNSRIFVSSAQAGIPNDGVGPGSAPGF